mgnify:CR=1 FL=1
MELKKLEWQRLYPVKKLLFLGAWLFCVFVVVVMTISFVRDGNIVDFLYGGGICGIAFVTVRPMIKYVRTSYHCMPYLNKIFSKCEQETFVASEEFQFFESVEVNNYLFPLGISKHWIYANRRLLSKDLAIFAWLEATSSLIARNTTPICVLYMTGECVEVDLGVHLTGKEQIYIHDYLWKEEGIISACLLGDKREEIINLFQKQFDMLKQSMNLDDKEMIKEILQSPEKYRNMYMERLPDYIKKWCEKERKVRKQ